MSLKWLYYEIAFINWLMREAGSKSADNYGVVTTLKNILRKDENMFFIVSEEVKGTTEDEMVGWHHRLNGHEFERTLGDGDGKAGLACCSPWGCKESDTTEQLN